MEILHIERQAAEGRGFSKRYWNFFTVPYYEKLLTAGGYDTAQISGVICELSLTLEALFYKLLGLC